MPTRNIIIFSGAGLSVDSGLGTFRDNDGLWAGYDVDVVCNYNNWLDNFELVHGFYNMRRRDAKSAQPNEAHIEIARWQSDYNVLNLTQNVDNLLERAGCENVVKLHGNVDELRCTNCNTVWISDADFDPSVVVCPNINCDGDVHMIKPNVVFFYEPAPEYETLAAVVDKLNSDDVVVVVGTSSNVLNFEAILRNVVSHKIYVNVEPPHQNIYDDVIILPAAVGMAAAKQVIDRL